MIRTFKEFAEEFAKLDISDIGEDNDLNDIKVSEDGDNYDDLINELNRLYTPVLVTQELEGGLKDNINEACSEDNILLERNIIKFDDDAKFAQLVSIAALLINRKKDSKEYQSFAKASAIRKEMKIRMQKNDHDEAVKLAKQYLSKIADSSNSSLIRKAADNLNNVN